MRLLHAIAGRSTSIYMINANRMQTDTAKIVPTKSEAIPVGMKCRKIRMKVPVTGEWNKYRLYEINAIFCTG